MSKDDGLVKFLLILTVGSVFGLIATIIPAIYCYADYDRNIGGHLKRAADANTVELAKTELSIAIKNIEARSFTKGSSHLFWSTPATDLEFWYKNLQVSLVELETIKSDASLVEKTNTLMKLRETLLDHGNREETVTAPENITLYPYQFTFFLVFGVFLFLFGISIFSLSIQPK